MRKPKYGPLRLFVMSNRRAAERTFSVAVLLSLAGILFETSGKNDTVYATIDVLSRFEPALPRNWSLGNAPSVFFRKTGDWVSPFVRPYRDTIRGSVGEFVFPATENLGRNSIGRLTGSDDRADAFSFWARHLSGTEKVDLTIFAPLQKKQYRTSIRLPNQWGLIRVRLTDFVHRTEKSSNLTPGEMGVLMFQTKGESRFLLDDFVVEAVGPNPFHVTRLRTEPWCFTSADTFSLRYHVSSYYRRKGRLQVRVTDHLGVLAAVCSTDCLVSTGLTPRSVQVKPLPSGFYSAGVRLEEPTGNGRWKGVDSISDHFIITGHPGPVVRTRTPIGVAVHHYACSRGQFTSLARAGFARVRLRDFTWRDLEPLPNQINFVHMDSLVSWAEAAGITFLASTGYAPSWKIIPPQKAGKWRPKDLGTAMYEDLDTATERMKLIARRYQGRIHDWEIGNEPDLHRPGSRGFWGSVEDYFQVLEAVSKGIYAGNPKASVVSGGITLDEKWADTGFVRLFLEKDMGRFVDCFGFHAYTKFARVRPFLEIVQNRYPEMSLWMTEVGLQRSGYDERETRRFVYLHSERLFRYLEYGVEFWEPLMIFPRLKRGVPHHGLLHANGSPTKCLSAIATASQLLRDLRGLRRVTESDRLTSYTFNSFPGKGMVVLSAVGTTIEINCESDHIRIVDAYGGSRKVKTKENPHSLAIEPKEVFYLFSDAELQITQD